MINTSVGAKNLNATKGRSHPQALLKQAVPFFGVIAIIAFFQIVSDGKLISSSNAKVLFNDIFMIVTGACGMSFLMATGEFDLSMGSIAAVSGMVAAYACQATGNMMIVFPVCVILGTVMGALNGFIITKFRITAFVGTIAMNYVLKGVAEVLGGSGEVTVPIAMMSWDTVELKAVTMAAVLIVGFIAFEYTPFGKRCRAVGSRKEAAIQSGVKVESVRRWAFVITGLASGIVAFFVIIRTGSASYQTGQSLSFNSLLALMLGGMAISGGASCRYRSAILGSVAMGLLASGLSLWGLDGIIQQFVRGIIFIITVALTFVREGVETIK